MIYFCFFTGSSGSCLAMRPVDNKVVSGSFNPRDKVQVVSKSSLATFVR